MSIVMERITFLSERNNITLYGLEKKLHIGKGTIKKWDKASPQLSSIILVAQYFDVSLDFLCGLTDSPQPSEPSKNYPPSVFSIADDCNRAQLTQEESEFIRQTIKWMIRLREKRAQE